MLTATSPWFEFMTKPPSLCKLQKQQAGKVSFGKCMTCSLNSKAVGLR